MKYNELNLNEGIFDGIRSAGAGLGAAAKSVGNSVGSVASKLAPGVTAAYKGGQQELAKKELPKIIADMHRLKDTIDMEFKRRGIDPANNPLYDNLVKQVNNYNEISRKLGLGRRSAYMNFEGADEIKAKLSTLQTELQKLQTTKGDPARIAELKSLISKEQKALAALNEGVFDTLRSVKAGVGAVGNAAAQGVKNAAVGTAQKVGNAVANSTIVQGAKSVVGGIATAANNAKSSYDAAASAKNTNILLQNANKQLQKLIASANHYLDILHPQTKV